MRFFYRTFYIVFALPHEFSLPSSSLPLSCPSLLQHSLSMSTYKPYNPIPLISYFIPSLCRYTSVCSFKSFDISILFYLLLLHLIPPFSIYVLPQLATYTLLLLPLLVHFLAFHILAPDNLCLVLSSRCVHRCLCSVVVSVLFRVSYTIPFIAHL